MMKFPKELILTITDRLRSGKRVRRRIGSRGWLLIDRPAPFLCVHRRPSDRPDPGTSRLVMGEGSYMVVDAEAFAREDLGQLLSAVCESLSSDFKAILIIELWSGSAPSGAGGALPAAPGCFRIAIPQDDAARVPAAAMARVLRSSRIAGRRMRVQITRPASPSQRGHPDLLSAEEARRLGALVIGLEVPPIYQEAPGRDDAAGRPGFNDRGGGGGGGVYPRVLREMHRAVSAALRQAIFRFAHLQTSHRPEHFLTLGQRVLLRAAREADEQLAAVAETFDLLLAVTPINAAEAEAEFRDSRFRRAPRFQYRLLNFDPDVLKRRLYGAALELVEDPALAELMRDKREELDRQITLLHDRNTDRFVHGSLQLYGGVDDALLATAERILELTAARRNWVASNHEPVGAAAFAARARDEIAQYRQDWPALAADVEIRDDIPGLLVSRGQLLISSTSRLADSRVEPLIHHEVGTHVLTFHNALTQPLKLLAAGLAGYDELQEGTAVMAEYLAGGLEPARLRLLAARVLAVRRMVDGRTFTEVFGELHDGHGFGKHGAFTTTARVFRGGGFTKDAIYLRGLVRLLAYLRDGGELESLFLGKVSEASLPVVRELRWRGVLRAAPLRPRYLDLPGATERLERLRRGADLVELVQESMRRP